MDNRREKYIENFVEKYNSKESYKILRRDSKL